MTDQRKYAAGFAAMWALYGGAAAVLVLTVGFGLAGGSVTDTPFVWLMVALGAAVGARIGWNRAIRRWDESTEADRHNPDRW